MKKTILIVDDENFLVETIEFRLKYLGYEVRSARDGIKALELLETQPVDLILMDCMMPSMDGLECTRRIRAQEKFKKLPVVFLSARAQKKDEHEALEAGANAYVSKPFDSDELVKTIEEWLK
jgi:CheY-like chemotaxis protein